jgi:hypothetical protein
MSMGMVLEGVRDWLRTKNEWDHMTCGVMAGSIPPNRAGQKYVALDDDGVDTGPDNTHGLTEIFGLEVGIWRRPGHLPKDQQWNMVIPEDVYLPEVDNLNKLERNVIFLLHQRWDLAAWLNQKYGLPSSATGDAFTGQLVYRGRSKIEAASGDGTNRFIGRRLRFRGLRRVQKITNDLG